MAIPIDDVSVPSIKDYQPTALFGALADALGKNIELDIIAKAQRDSVQIVIAPSGFPGAAAYKYNCSGSADQIVINSAITAANAVGGGAIELLSGSYSTNSAILHLSNVHMFCAVKHAAHITIDEFTEAQYLALASPVLSNVWLGSIVGSNDGIENFSIENIWFDGNRPNQTWAITGHDDGSSSDNAFNAMKTSGTAASPCRNFRIKGCKGTGGLYHGIFVVNDAYNFIVNENLCAENGYRGCHIHGEDFNAGIEAADIVARYQVSNNWIYANGKSTTAALTDAALNTGLFACFDNANNAVVSNNFIWDERGAGLHAGGSTLAAGVPTTRPASFNLVTGNQVAFCGHPLLVNLFIENTLIVDNDLGFAGAQYVITITNGGSGYTSEPVVAVTGADATFQPIVVDGIIVAIVCVSNGTTGLTEGSKTLTITGGGGTLAAANAYCHPVTYAANTGYSSVDRTARGIKLDRNKFHNSILRGLELGGRNISGSNECYENGTEGFRFNSSVDGVTDCDLANQRCYHNASWGIQAQSGFPIYNVKLDGSQVFANGAGLQLLGGGSAEKRGFSLAAVESYNNNNYQLDLDSSDNFDILGGQYDNGGSLYTGMPFRVRSTCNDGRISSPFCRRNQSNGNAYQVDGTNMQVDNIKYPTAELGRLTTAMGAGVFGQIANTTVATLGGGTIQAKLKIKYVNPANGVLTVGYIALEDAP